MTLEDLYHTWGGRCAYCDEAVVLGAKMDNPRRATRDHFIPKAMGGRHGKRNTVLSCDTCNEEKGASDPRKYVAAWHKLDAKGLKAYIDDLGDEPRASLGGRIRSLLRRPSGSWQRSN